jgi:hypothetical protein
MADQTFGNTTIGNESTSGLEGAVFVAPFTTPAIGGGGTCTFYLYCKGEASPYPGFATGVWADSSGNPGALLATGPVLTPSNTTAGWLSGTFTWSGIVGGTTYWLGAIMDDTAGSSSVFDTASSNVSRYRWLSGYPTLPDPFGSPTTNSRSYCAYVVYPEASGGTVIPIFMNQYRQRRQ